MHSDCSKLWAGHLLAITVVITGIDSSQAISKRTFSCPCNVPLFHRSSALPKLFCCTVYISTKLNKTITCFVLWQYGICVCVLVLSPCAFDNTNILQMPKPNMTSGSFCLIVTEKMHCWNVFVLCMTLLHGVAVCHKGMTFMPKVVLHWCDAMLNVVHNVCSRTRTCRVMTSFFIHSFIHSFIEHGCEAWRSKMFWRSTIPSFVRWLVHHHAFHQSPPTLMFFITLSIMLFVLKSHHALPSSIVLTPSLWHPGVRHVPSIQRVPSPVCEWRALCPSAPALLPEGVQLELEESANERKSLSPPSAVPLNAVRKMSVYDQRATTMRVKWEAAPGASGYMLLYSALNASRPTREAEVRTCWTTSGNRGRGWGSEMTTLRSCPQGLLRVLWGLLRDKILKRKVVLDMANF